MEKEDRRRIADDYDETEGGAGEECLLRKQTREQFYEAVCFSLKIKLKMVMRVH